MDKLSSPIFFQLSKVDLIQRTVEGIATAEQPDKSGEICDYESTKPYYEKWSDGFRKATDGKSLGNVRAMHGNVAAGKVTALNFDDEQKQISITAKIVDDAEWNKVVEGVYTGFSHGGSYVNKWKDGDFTRYTADPTEVSIVDNPCLGSATFQVVKEDGATEMRKFHVKPELETKGEKARDAKKNPEQKWETTDGKTFAKKQDAIEHQGKLDADEFAAQVIGRVQKVVDDMENELDKREFSEEERKKLAESGHAMEDGSFPISSEQDLKNAIQAIGRAKDPEKAKEHIKTRAKAMGLESLVPDEWKLAKVEEMVVVEPESVHKSLEHEVGEAVIKKSGLHAEHAKNVSEIHGHAHKIMDHVHKAMHGVAADQFMHVMKDQHHTEDDEEHVEKAHGHAQCIADKCMKMVDGDAPALSDEHKGHVHEIHKSATNVMDAAHKFLHGDGNKAMHHDAHDRAQLHKMHTNSHEIAEKCIKMFGEGEDEAEKVAKLAKAESERDELLLKATAERDALVKAVADFAPKLEEMQKRINFLEKQPAARKGALFAVDQDRHEAEEEPVETRTVNVTSLRLSPEELRGLTFAR